MNLPAATIPYVFCWGGGVLSNVPWPGSACFMHFRMGGLVVEHRKALKVCRYYYPNVTSTLLRETNRDHMTDPVFIS